MSKEKRIYSSIGAYKTTKDVVKIYALKSGSNIADLLDCIVNEYSERHPEFQNLLTTFNSTEIGVRS
jgi:hypothetical protein